MGIHASNHFNKDDFRLVTNIYGLEYLNLEFAFYNLDDKEIDETNANKIELPYYMLEGLGKLESLILPSNITHISNFNISDCWSLLSVVIPKGVCLFGDINHPNVFSDCDCLQDIKVSSENRCFADIDGILTNKDKTILKCYPPGRTDECVVIPDGVKVIGEFAFYGNESLTSIVIPDSVTTIGEGVFTYRNLDNIIISPNHPYFLYVDGILMNREQTELITCINKHVKSDVVLPDSITYIPERFFSFCKNIISICIPNSITNIDDYTFYYCKNLTSIVIPDSVTTIEDQAFHGCEKLENIFIAPDHPSFLYEDGILMNREQTELIVCINKHVKSEVVLPESITSIPEGFFNNCDNIESINIPKSVKSIEHSAFRDCRSLTSVVIPNNVTTIGCDAFNGCKSLTSFVIPNGLTSICSQTFMSCESLISIVVPNSITDIDMEAFMGCESLTSIEIPNSVTIIHSEAFKGCESLTSIIIPNSVIDIDNRAFMDCKSLSSIIIPNGVTRIYDNIFGNCERLESVTFGIEINYIGEHCFTNCDNLRDIFIHAETPPAIAGQSNEINNVTLHVPAASLDAYKTHPDWQGFKEYVSL